MNKQKGSNRLCCHWHIMRKSERVEQHWINCSFRVGYSKATWLYGLGRKEPFSLAYEWKEVPWLTLPLSLSDGGNQREFLHGRENEIRCHWHMAWKEVVALFNQTRQVLSVDASIKTNSVCEESNLSSYGICQKLQFTQGGRVMRTKKRKSDT